MSAVAWSRQPQAPVNVAARYLPRLVLQPALGLLDSSFGVALTASGSPARVTGRRGFAAQMDSGSKYFTATRNGPALLQSSFTIVTQFRQSGSLTNGGPIVRMAGTGGGIGAANKFEIYTLTSGVVRADYFAGDETNTPFDTGAVLSVGGDFTLVFVYDATAGTLRWAVNGTVGSAGTAVGPARNNEASSFSILGGSGQPSLNQDVSLFAILGRALSASEMAAISAQPWALFESKPSGSLLRMLAAGGGAFLASIAETAAAADSSSGTVPGSYNAARAESASAAEASSARYGRVTTPPLKNNTGTVLASLTGVVVNVYNATTGALVVRKTGLTTDASGVAIIEDQAISASGSYAYEPDLTATGSGNLGRRLPVATAT